MITLLTYYLWEHYQRVVLNGQTLSWELVKSGVTQGSESWTNLESNFKIFIIFYKVFDKLVSLATLNRDLKLINNWAFQWKMQFNPDWNKQAQESYFSKKAGNQRLLDITFNKNNVASSPSAKTFRHVAWHLLKL